MSVRTLWMIKQAKENGGLFSIDIVDDYQETIDSYALSVVSNEDVVRFTVAPNISNNLVGLRFKPLLMDAIKEIAIHQFFNNGKMTQASEVPHCSRTPKGELRARIDGDLSLSVNMELRKARITIAKHFITNIDLWRIIDREFCSDIPSDEINKAMKENSDVIKDCMITYIAQECVLNNHPYFRPRHILVHGYEGLKNQSLADLEMDIRQWFGKEGMDKVLEKYRRKVNIENFPPANKSYVVCKCDDSDFYIPNAVHIERNDSLMLVENDEEASKVALHDGVRLIRGMYGVPDDVYLDTPQNRETIIEELKKDPSYMAHGTENMKEIGYDDLQDDMKVFVVYDRTDGVWSQEILQSARDGIENVVYDVFDDELCLYDYRGSRLSGVRNNIENGAIKVYAIEEFLCN